MIYKTLDEIFGSAKYFIGMSGSIRIGGFFDYIDLSINNTKLVAYSNTNNKSERYTFDAILFCNATFYEICFMVDKIGMEITADTIAFKDSVNRNKIFKNKSNRELWIKYIRNEALRDLK